MKKIKVKAYYREPYTIYPELTRWQVFKAKMVHLLKLSGVVVSAVMLVYVSYAIGSTLNIQTVVEVKEIAPTYPVLDRIAQCESHTSHYCTDALIAAKLCAPSEKGQVLVKANANKTVDIGMYQVNSIWGAEASKQGLNLYDEEDNKAFSEWLYHNKGTGDWSA